MTRCVCCDHDFVPEQAQSMCRGCWYSGAFLESKMAGVIEVLEYATGSPWEAEHTGGGCFWLITHLDHGPDGHDWGEACWDGSGRLEHCRVLIATSPDGPLAGDDTVADLDTHEGWMIGAYDRAIDDNLEDGEYSEPLLTEEVPMVARKMAEQLTGRLVGVGAAD